MACDLRAVLEDTGDRHPLDSDRVQCRKNLLEAIKSKQGVKGSGCFPHEIVRAMSEENMFCDVDTPTRMSDAEVQLANAQWCDMMKTLNAQWSGAQRKRMSRFLAVVDVSGSMMASYGPGCPSPISVAIALGLVFSELSQHLKNRVVTFSDTPKCVTLPDTQNIAEKVRAMKRMDWGANTNFVALYRLLLKIAIDHGVPNAEMPTLVVVSDMQYDHQSAFGQWTQSQQDHHYYQYQYQQYHERRSPEERTPYEDMKAEFQAAGYDVPKSIFWNVCGSGQSGLTMPVSAKCPDTTMLSGYSPALMDAICKTGEIMTPAAILRQTLDDARFDRVRETIARFLPR
jgi:hypothetical protein